LIPPEGYEELLKENPDPSLLVVTNPATTHSPTLTVLDSKPIPKKAVVSTVPEAKEVKPVVPPYKFTSADIIRIFTERDPLKIEYIRMKTFYKDKYKSVRDWQAMKHHTVARIIEEELLKEAFH
jgi:hypothetical protein